MKARHIAGMVAFAAIASWNPDPANSRVMEDSPKWSWSTMGNLQRSVYYDSMKRRVVVDACSFAYADFRGIIDWKRTKTMRGDEYARRNGCNRRKYAGAPNR